MYEQESAADVVVQDGQLRWLYATGRTLPLVRGGDGEPGEGGTDGGTEGGTDGGTEGGTDGGTEGEPGDGAQDAELRRANAEAAKYRRRLREMEAREQERLDAEKSEVQRAQDAAAAAEMRAAEAAQRIAAAEIKAALAGVVPDPAAVVEDLNLSRFLNDEGEIDTGAVAALRERYTKLVPPPDRTPRPNGAQGATGSTPPNRSEGQLTRDDLKKMSPDEIVAAHEAGRLNDALAGRSQ